MFLYLLNISAFSFCLDCCVWGGLSVGWKFVVPLFVKLAPCGWGWTSGFQGFLVREACVGVLVGEAGFLLSGVQ